MKVHHTIVWHEIGHVFGYVLIDRIYNDYRNITDFFLTKESSLVISKQENIQPTDRSNDAELINTILILVMGAVFHTFKFKREKEIKLSDFNKIFLFTDYKLKIESIYGYAGNDFFIICQLIKQEKSSINNKMVISFTFELLKILKTHKIFSKLENLINIMENKYNGMKSRGNDLLIDERKKISKTVSFELESDIKNLIKDTIANKGYI
jgi:hypothetical protein